MILRQHVVRIQWMQLMTLSCVHFFVDMFGGMLAPVLLDIQDAFKLSLAQAIVILTVLNMSCNFFQVFTGHMRAHQRRPFFLFLGMAISCIICFVGFYPQTSYSLWLLITASIISGAGIAVTHPEGLRAIHTINRIPASLVTAVFMTAGFAGFASGGYIGAHLVTAIGLKGLSLLAIGPAVGLILLSTLKVRLATGTGNERLKKNTAAVCHYPFSFILLMAIPMTLASTILVTLLPTRLQQLDFSRNFGGFSTMVAGLAGALGNFFWAWIAHKKSNLLSAVIAVMGGVPCFLFYLQVLDHSLSLIMLAAGGFFSVAAFPVLVTMARNARGLTLGQRMGMIVGGSFGFASLVVMALGKVVEHIGIQPVLYLIPAGYLLSGIFGIFLIIKTKKVY